MEPFSINELGGLITVVAGAIATVLFALQKSSCTDIRCESETESEHESDDDGFIVYETP